MKELLSALEKALEIKDEAIRIGIIDPEYVRMKYVQLHSYPPYITNIISNRLHKAISEAYEKVEYNQLQGL